MKDSTKPGAARRTVCLACACALMLGCAACRRAHEGERPQVMNSAGNQAVANSPGVSGTPGYSDAAQHARAFAPVSATAP